MESGAVLHDLDVTRFLREAVSISLDSALVWWSRSSLPHLSVPFKRISESKKYKIR
jgi:hypothetical protein